MSVKKGCENCPRKKPDLLPENVDVMELWKYMTSQWRVSGFGFAGLDYNALYRTAEVMQIQMTEDILVKIQRLEAYTLERNNGS